MRIAAFAACLAACSVQAFAEPPEEISEADFLAALTKGHPAFAVLEEAVGAARAAAVSARTLDNPELEVTREDPSEELGLALAWQLPSPARRRLAITAAEREVEAARARVVADRLAVRLALRQAFAEWAVAAASAERRRSRVERLAALAERERRRAERGESSGLEARRLALAVAEARGRLAVADAGAVRARAAARAWRPDLPGGATPVVPALPEGLPTTDAEHPRVAALEAELAAARLAGEAAGRAGRWPRLVAGWKSVREGGETSGGPVLGFAWPLPLADRRQAERLLASARAEAAEARLELARRRLEAEQAGAATAYRRLAAAAAESAAANAGNDEMVDAAEAAFRLGESTLTDLLEVLRATTEAELAALDLHASALAAHRDLEAASGGPEVGDDADEN